MKGNKLNLKKGEWSIIATVIVGFMLIMYDSSPTHAAGVLPPCNSETCANGKIELFAQNTRNTMLQNKVIIKKITIPPALLVEDKINQIRLKDSLGTALFVYAIPSSIEKHLDGSIKSMKIVFRDTFAANGSKHYNLYLNVLPVDFGGSTSMSVESEDAETHSYRISNDLADYTVTNEKDAFALGGRYSKLIVNSEEGWSYALLAPIVGAVLNPGDPEQAFSISIGTGLPSEENVTISPFMAAISFVYKQPFLPPRPLSYDGLGGCYKECMGPICNTYCVSPFDVQDIFEARATVFMFAGDPHVYTDSTYVLNTDLYIHNSFIKGAFVSDFGDVILGTAPMDKPLQFSTWSGSQFMGLVNMVDGHLTPSIYTVTKDIPSLAYNGFQNIYKDYYVVRKAQGGVLVYDPDFQRLASGPLLGTYKDQKDRIIPKSQLIKGYQDSISKWVIADMSGTGLGESWIKTKTPAGVYETSSVLMPEVDYADDYDLNDYNTKVSELNAIAVTQEGLWATIQDIRTLVDNTLTQAGLNSSMIDQRLTDAVVYFLVGSRQGDSKVTLTGNPVDILNLANNVQYNPNPGYESSLIQSFAGALWDLRQNPRMTVADVEKLALESMKFWPTGLTLSTCVIQADQRLYGGVHINYILSAFERHGARAQDAIINGNQVTIRGSLYNQARIISHNIPSIMSPGQTVTVQVVVEDLQPGWGWSPQYNLTRLESKNSLADGIIRPNFTVIPYEMRAAGTSSLPSRATITFNLTAPNVPGVYPCDWQIHHYVDAVNGRTGQVIPGYINQWVGEILVQDIAVMVPITLKPGNNFIGLPFDPEGRHLSELIPLSAQYNGSQIIRWNNELQTWNSAITYRQNSATQVWGWTVDVVLEPGEAFYVKIPAGRPDVQLKMLGKYPGKKYKFKRPAPGKTMPMGSMSVKQTRLGKPGDIETQEFPVMQGDVVQAWNASTQSYSSSYVYQEEKGGWFPGNIQGPLLDAGQVFWVRTRP